MNNCKHQGVIYTSEVFKCHCNSSKFHSNGATCCDDYMVEDDELTCLQCGEIFVVHCDDGFCELLYWKDKND